MLTPVRSTQFKRDVRRAEKRGKDLSKLRVLLTSLIRQKLLSARYLDHPLRDCHRTSDSIYRYLRQDLVVPFSMEGIAFNVECGDLFIGDLEAGRVEV